MTEETITKRIDSITHIPEDFLVPNPPVPKSVKIELTGRCNYRCGFCALRSRTRQPVGDMDFDFFKRITREMIEAGVEEIGIFYLGETLMAPDLAVDAVKYLKDDLHCPYVFLTTNGSLAKPEVIEALMEAGLDSLKFSMNNADEDQFKEIAQVKGKLFHDAMLYLKSTKAVRDAKGYATKIYASSIMYDGEQQKRMEELVKERVAPYVDEHYWLPLYSMGSVAIEREEELGFKPTAGNMGRVGGLVPPLPCWSAFTEGHVRADGKFSLCCFDADGRFQVGDLNTQSFMDVWHGKEFQIVRRAHLDEDVTGTVCEQCVAYS